MEWQPIETAPDFDVPFLAYVPANLIYKAVVLRKRKNPVHWAECGYFVSFFDGNRSYNPTHWMPLPTPPTTKEQ